MPGPTPISQRSRKAEKNEIATWHEGRGQPGLGDRNGRVACKRGLRNGGERVEHDHMTFTQTGFPGSVQSRHAFAYARPHSEFDGVPLAIVESDRLDAGETLERPGEANRRVLPAGKENKCCVS